MRNITQVKKIIFPFVILMIIIAAAVIIYREMPGAVTEDEIRDISVLEFSSDEALRILLKNKSKERLKGIFYIAIAVSADNTANHDTTRTSIFNSQYLYKYVYVTNTQAEVSEKDLYKLFHDPTHPDSFLSGDMEGYVKYPDINKYDEAGNIYKIVDILRKL